MASNKLAKLICKVVGHDWNYETCNRCGQHLAIQVFVDGVLLCQGSDYAVVDKEVSFVEAPRAGSRISIFSRIVSERTNVDIVGDGGTATYTFSYGE